MCIIAVYRENTPMLEEEIEVMWHYNPDGVGMAIYNKDNGKWKVEKGIMKLSDLLFKLKELNYLNNIVDTTVILHFRAATHGGVNKVLTHPFKIHTKDKEMFLFHNGVFSIHVPNSYRRYKDYKTAIDYTDYYLYSNYGYFDYKDKEQDEAIEFEDMLDPLTFSRHSDTSLVAKYLSELNFESEKIITLLKNPIMEEIISHSRLCICVENEPEPTLIGNWEFSNNRSFSNSGYKYSRKYTSTCDVTSLISKKSYTDYEKDKFLTENSNSYCDTGKRVEKEIDIDSIDTYDNFSIIKYKNLHFTLLEDHNIALLDYYFPSKIQSDDSKISLKFDKKKKHIKLVIQSENNEREYTVSFYDEKEYDVEKIDDRKFIMTSDGELYVANINRKNQIVLDKLMDEFVQFPKVKYFYDSNSKRLYKLKKQVFF